MDSCELSRVKTGAVGVAFIIPERKGASQVRAQTRESRPSKRAFGCRLGKEIKQTKLEKHARKLIFAGPPCRR